MTWLEHPRYARSRDKLIELFARRALSLQRGPAVVFLCGKYKSRRREHLRAVIAQKFTDFLLFYAEHVWDVLLQGGPELNLLQLESQLGGLSDAIIVLAESPGTFAELGAFSHSEYIRPNLLAVLDKEFEGDQSFLNDGPIRWIDTDSRFRPSIYAWWEPHFEGTEEVIKRLQRIPRTGRLEKPLEIRRKKGAGKHLLFLTCDLVAVIGPASTAHVHFYLKGILGAHPAPSAATLLALGKALGLLRSFEAPDSTTWYFRPLEQGRIEPFLSTRNVNLVVERARMLSVMMQLPSAAEYIARMAIAE